MDKVEGNSDVFISGSSGKEESEAGNLDRSKIESQTTFSLFFIVMKRYEVFGKNDTSIPNGRGYCDVEDAWAGRMSLFEEKSVDCQECPLKDGWYCEYPRLLRCDPRIYDIAPIGAICGIRDSEKWQWVLRKIDDLRRTLRTEKGKKSCGYENTEEEIVILKLLEQLGKEFEKEVSPSEKDSFLDYMELFLEVLTRSKEHFQVEIVEKREGGRILSSTVKELSTRCALYVWTVQQIEIFDGNPEVLFGFVVILTICSFLFYHALSCGLK